MKVTQVYNNGRIVKGLLAALLTATLCSCDFSFSNIELNKAQRAVRKKDFQSAVDHFGRVVARHPGTPAALDAAREAARVSELDLKSFDQAIRFNRYIVDNAKEERERRQAQKKIAQIFFEIIGDYPASIVEINKLLVLRNDQREEAELRHQLAKAHFYLNQFIEARAEIEAALRIVSDGNSRFDLTIFLANVLFNTKKTEAAAALYEDLLKLNPERAKAENLVMNIVVCYEEMQQFDRAIERLVALREEYHDKEFVDLKIKRLRERKANMPGAKGFRK